MHSDKQSLNIGRCFSDFRFIAGCLQGKDKVHLFPSNIYFILYVFTYINYTGIYTYTYSYYLEETKVPYKYSF
jgi:hypothetical protein